MPLLLLTKFKKPLILLISSLFLLATGFLIGKKNSKPEVKIETKEVIVEKIVEKVVKVSESHKKENENTKTVIVKQPDGTEVTTIETKRETKEDSVAREESSKEQDKLSSKETKITPVGKNYRLSALAIEKLPKLNDLTSLEKPDYQLLLGRRLLGDIWVDAGYQIKNNAAVAGLSWEF